MSLFFQAHMTNFYNTPAVFTAKNGQTVSFTEVFNAISTSVEVYAHTKGYKLTAQDIEDIKQDAALKAIRYASTYDPERSQPATWASRIAVSCAIDAMKAANRYAASTIEDEQSDLFVSTYSADAETLTNESLAAIETGIDRLGENQRYILGLHLEGMKPRKMAEEIGCTPNAASVLLCRARKSLARELQFLS